MNSLPKEIAAVLAEVREMPSVESAWLFGSRVNAEPSASSDWDVMLFATERVIEEIARRWPNGVPELDLLVVYDGENFRSPWRRAGSGTFKKGTLTDWEWMEIQAGRARYTQTKATGKGNVDTSDAHAVLLFPKKERAG